MRARSDISRCDRCGRPGRAQHAALIIPPQGRQCRPRGVWASMSAIRAARRTGRTLVSPLTTAYHRRGLHRHGAALAVRAIDGVARGAAPRPSLRRARSDLLRDGPSDPREVLPDQDPRPLLHPLRRWGQQVPAASQWPLGSIPGSQGYMIVWAQTHPRAIIHLCYTIAITLSKI